MKSPSLRQPIQRTQDTAGSVTAKPIPQEVNPPVPPESARKVVGVGLTVLAFLVPVVAYFWFIHHYGLNMIWSDQWDDINLVAHLNAHNLSFGQMWAQHNENRILFPNLIVLALARLTHLNVLVEEYLSALMLVVSAALVITAHRRRSPTTPWIFYWPVALIMLSFVQFYNALFGFQMAWYLVMLMLSLAVFLLDRQTLGWGLMSAAIGAAVIGSLSSLQGLLIWPAGLVVLLCRRRTRPVIAVWIGAAIATGIAYFENYRPAGNETNGSYLYVLHHPLTGLEFYFLAIGNMLGIQIPFSRTTHNAGVLIFGIFVVAVGLGLLVVQLVRRDEFGPAPLGAALICYSLLFAGVFTEGRAVPGWGLSAGIRYETFDLLILVGCYLALLDGQFGRPDGNRWAKNWWATGSSLLIRTGIFAAVCLVLVFGTINGLNGARSWHRTQLLSADFAVNIDRIPTSVTNASLIPGFLKNMSFIRQMQQVAKAQHLSLFDTDLAILDARAGLPSIVRPATTMLSPVDGAELRGTETLRAGVSAPFGGPYKVEFELSRSRGGSSSIGVATSSWTGWTYAWDTTTVPDGTYTVRSVVYVDGRSTPSKAVEVHVGN